MLNDPQWSIMNRGPDIKMWLLLLALAAAGCSSGTDQLAGPAGQTPPVVIVALDGLSWQVARPLIDGGEMPQLARLVSQGASGQLETARPTWTPLLFTTMATGKRPEEHGISTFVSSEGIPLTSNLRQVPALWNILSAYRQPTLFFGWPVTWPAEPVQGEMISDRWHKTTDRHVHPPASADWLSPALQDFRDRWDGSLPALERLAGLATPERVSPYLHGVFEGGGPPGQDDPYQLVGLTRKKVETGFLWIAALDSEVKLPIFLRRVEAVRPRLSAVYFNATDMAQHFFGGADCPGENHRPERNPAGREVIEEAYRVYDRLLGLVVSGVRKLEGYQECIVVVLSDHGIDLASGPTVRIRPPSDVKPGQEGPFLQQLLALDLPADQTSLLPPHKAGGEWHLLSFPPTSSMARRSRLLNRLDTAGCRFHGDDTYLYFVHNEAPPGVVVISGGDLLSGQPVNGMSVEDIAPTVLALLGLPAALDMAGRPVELQLTPAPGNGPRTLTAEMVPTHGTSPSANTDREAISSAEDQQIREDLRALGYIE
jgi:hypothetical protein